MNRRGCSGKDIDAIAVTAGPGLVGSLLVGLTFAKAVALVRGLPLIGINHIEGHIYAVLLEAELAGDAVELPALALVASGGHTHLFEVREYGSYRLLGKTRDDAAGEAYDKVAKLLGFGYPGGPVLDRLAPYGDADAMRLPLAKMKGNALDFSFSGLKTAMLRWTQAREMEGEVIARRALQKLHPRPSVDQWLTVTPQTTLDAIAAFSAGGGGGAAAAGGTGDRRERSAQRDCVGRGGLECGAEGRGTLRAAEVSGVFPDAATLHRQRGDDRRRGVPTLPAEAVRRPDAQGAIEPVAHLRRAAARIMVYARAEGEPPCA